MSAPTTPPPDTFDREELEEAIAEAATLIEDVDNYRGRAEAIDDEYRRLHEDDRYTLDDLPYGEELIRTRELPGALFKAASGLDRLSDDRASAPAVLSAGLRSIQAILEDARSTLDDCTAIPPDNDW